MNKIFGPDRPQLTMTNACRRFGPNRKTAKSSSNDAARSIPRRCITAKLVRSTKEKSWSRKASPICQAASRSAVPTGATDAVPFRSPSQNLSAARRWIRQRRRVQVSNSTWSVVTSRSPPARMSLLRWLFKSEESAAAYHTDVSTKRLIWGNDPRAALTSRAIPGMRQRSSHPCFSQRQNHPRFPSRICKPHPLWPAALQDRAPPVGACTQPEKPRVHWRAGEPAGAPVPRA